MKKTLLVCGIVAIIAVGIGILLLKYGNATSVAPTAAPLITNNFSDVPKDAQLLANLKAATLDALSSEGAALHIHQHLDIVINNQTITIPAEIGIGSNFISPLHVHDTTGVLHVESPVIKDFTLGQFFTEWGVTLSDTCIGSYCVDQNHKLIVAVNGNPIQRPQNLVLKAHDEIEIWYGDVKINPNLIKSYAFASGL